MDNPIKGFTDKVENELQQIRETFEHATNTVNDKLADSFVGDIAGKLSEIEANSKAGAVAVGALKMTSIVAGGLLVRQSLDGDQVAFAAEQIQDAVNNVDAAVAANDVSPPPPSSKCLKLLVKNSARPTFWRARKLEWQMLLLSNKPILQLMRVTHAL